MKKREITCEFCSQTFKGDGGLNSHLAHTHGRDTRVPPVGNDRVSPGAAQDSDQAAMAYRLERLEAAMLELADARSEQDKLLEQQTTLTNDIVGRLGRLDDVTNMLCEGLPTFGVRVLGDKHRQLSQQISELQATVGTHASYWSIHAGDDPVMGIPDVLTGEVKAVIAGLVAGQ